MTQYVSTTSLAVDFQQGLTDAWSKVATFVPKFIAFLVILAIGWFVSKIIAKVVDRILRKVGFERLSERAGSDRMLANSQYDATGIVSKVVYYGLLLVTLQLAFGVFGPNPISGMIDSIVAWLPRALVALVLVVVAMAIANAVRTIVRGVLSGVSYGNTVATVVWGVIIALGVIAALGQAGIATAVTQPVLYAVLAAAAGILIVGVGGGAIVPMRQRMERWMSSAEQESAKAKAGTGAYMAGREDAMTQQQREQERQRRGMGGGAGGANRI
ncbi:mechanosensitive ion channel family protein [Streptomyces thermolilacinus]|uniref:mechanosensitive ion channel family protein n=1 Tax=Streptomyces thermolilacinus TaxID=285540 RepID=UPI0033C0F65F